MTHAADRLYEDMLVLRCQAGDETAFAELVERYQPRLGYYLRNMLRDSQEAEDAVQDVWVAVFRAVPRLADRGPGLALPDRARPGGPPASPAASPAP
jgi:RNA polymerase sigma-70 factor (ECF subfamily)